jgi:hypothetical protein
MANKSSITLWGREIKSKERHTTELPKNHNGTEIGALGQVQITQALNQYHQTQGITPRFGANYRDFFPEGWSWTWFSTKTVLKDPRLPKGELTLQGALPNRLANFYYKVYGRTLPEQLKEQIGNFAKLDTPDINVTYWDITTEFDWRAGQFGDSNSCYWSDRARAKDHIVNHGGAALRFFRGLTGEGIGRAWIVPHKLEDGTETWVVFNGYGATTQSLARFFGTEFKQFYKRCKVTVDGSAFGVVYINAEGYGYIVGPIDKIDKIDHVDFKWNVHTSSDSDSGTMYCHGCDAALYDGDYVDEDGLHYCPDCWWNTHFSCNYCGDSYRESEGTYVDSVGETVCENCLREQFVRSDHSHEWFELDSTTSISYLPPENGNPFSYAPSISQTDIIVALDEIEDFVSIDLPAEYEGVYTTPENVVFTFDMNDNEIAVLATHANQYLPERGES